MKKMLVMILILSGTLFSQSVGTKAPDFTYATPDHGTISLSDYSGRVVYLFFFGWN